VTTGEQKDRLRSLLAAARSNEPERHAEVAKQLRTSSVLEALDSKADYVNAAKFRLRVAQVVEALARNTTPSAHEAFLSLTANDVFLAEDERTMSLVRASVHIRPAPPALVAFWDRHSQPEDGFSPTTITTLIDNGSPPALALFEKKMLDPAHEDNDKVAWMRTRILSHRNDVALLETCERLLRALPEHLRPLLVEVLFDYRPGEWFRPATGASAPPLESASRPALELLIRIGTAALTSAPLTAEQRAAVELRLQEARKLRER